MRIWCTSMRISKYRRRANPSVVTITLKLNGNWILGCSICLQAKIHSWFEIQSSLHALLVMWNWTWGLCMHITTAYRCLDAYLQFLTLSIRYWLIHGQASQDSQCFLLASLMNHNMSREIHRREKGGREGVRFRHKINQCNHHTLPLCYYSAKADIFTRTTAHCLDKCGILWYVIVHQNHAINLTTALLLNPHSSVGGGQPWPDRRMLTMVSLISFCCATLWLTTALAYSHLVNSNKQPMRQRGNMLRAFMWQPAI